MGGGCGEGSTDRRWHLPSPFLLTFGLTGMENQFFLFSKHFFFENKTRKS
jgi:hypothetical protein